MCQFIETILVLNGCIENLAYHEERLNKTRNAFLPQAAWCSLDFLKHKVFNPNIRKQKLRIVYDTKQIVQIDLSTYHQPTIKSLKIVNNDELNYNHKYLDRTDLAEMKQANSDFDELLIVQHNCITDTTFSNIALKKQNKWVTPKTTLLQGTKRKQLLSCGLLTEEDITTENIFQYECLSLINAMNDLEEIVVPISNVYR